MSPLFGQVLLTPSPGRIWSAASWGNATVTQMRAQWQEHLKLHPSQRCPESLSMLLCRGAFIMNMAKVPHFPASLLLAGVVALVTCSGTCAQTQSEWKVPECAKEKCSGKRVISDLGFFAFCVPRGFSVTWESGEHGDIHYDITVRHSGQKYHLYFVSGPYFTGKDPSGGDPRWSSRPWICKDLRGEDFRVQQGSRLSRYITLNALMGYATYRDVPKAVATRLDGVLDSLCCDDCQPCRGNQIKR